MSADVVEFSYELVVHPPLYQPAWLPRRGYPTPDADEWVRNSENVYFPDESLRWTVDLARPAAAGHAGGVDRAAGPLARRRPRWCARGSSCSLVPGRPGFALAVLAAMAFNPLFLFMSVSVSNDIWATALTAQSSGARL
ncbi:MAG: hypothetical protein R2851_09095 [Caldilineaceae bacterium]